MRNRLGHILLLANFIRYIITYIVSVMVFITIFVRLYILYLLFSTKCNLFYISNYYIINNRIIEK